MHFGKSEEGYERLLLNEEGQKEENSVVENVSKSRSNTTLLACLKCLLAFALCLALAIVYYNQTHHEEFSNRYPDAEKSCLKPDIRKEWRALTSNERNDYRSAVTCLGAKPSRLGLNQTLHDDFAYIHIWYGHDSHDGVSFFAYHRWFLHLYEKALRNECGYRGSMTYWDWSLDWQAPYKSSILDPKSGLGGEGSKSSEGIRGYCVDSGPLPNHQIPFFETLEKPHCLSREYLTNQTELQHWAGMWDPNYLEKLLSEDNFSKFVALVEDGPHIALPKMLHGDFSTRGAPVDPIFMLHHGNLDRLYWEWQKRKPETRMKEYSGKKTAQDPGESASLEDKLVFGELGRSVRVAELMRTEGEALCYRYE